MRLALIVAMAENRVIGRDNQLPWHLPNDLKYFKKMTLGKPIIMGRKTFESIGKPLPGRRNIVVTRQSDWRREGVQVGHTLEQAVSLAKQIAAAEGNSEMLIIGGAALYRESLPLADRLYMTKIHEMVEGDAFFPPLKEEDWCELSREDCNSDANNPYNYSFVVLQRVTQSDKR
ncbi:MAG: dihydrofolate reductase [Exilibacterium sp.]